MSYERRSLLLIYIFLGVIFLSKFWTGVYFFFFSVCHRQTSKDRGRHKTPDKHTKIFPLPEVLGSVGAGADSKGFVKTFLVWGYKFKIILH